MNHLRHFFRTTVVIFVIAGPFPSVAATNYVAYDITPPGMSPPLAVANCIDGAHIGGCTLKSQLGGLDYDVLHPLTTTKVYNRPYIWTVAGAGTSNTATDVTDPSGYAGNITGLHGNVLAEDMTFVLLGNRAQAGNILSPDSYSGLMGSVVGVSEISQVLGTDGNTMVGEYNFSGTSPSAAIWPSSGNGWGNAVDLIGANNSLFAATSTLVAAYYDGANSSAYAVQGTTSVGWAREDGCSIDAVCWHMQPDGVTLHDCVDLTTLMDHVGGAGNADARGLSGDLIVGEWEDKNSADSYHAWLWYGTWTGQNSGPRLRLQSQDGYGNSCRSWAVGVSKTRNEAVGGYANGSTGGNTHACVWNLAGDESTWATYANTPPYAAPASWMVDLCSFLPAGTLWGNCCALAIDDQGDIVGFASSPTDGSTHAILWVPIGTLPSAPTGLQATAGDGQVALCWTVSTGATNYNVKRSTNSGGETTIANPATTNYIDMKLANGLTYFYVVSAVNSAGESPNSVEASTTPVAASPSGFTLWSAGQGLTGDVATLFGQNGSNGVANGFVYAFGTNFSPGQNMLNIRMVGGHPVVELPKRDANTAPYASILLMACTNLASSQTNWSLPIAPSALSLGKPANCDWYELQGSPSNAFFRLKATLLPVSSPVPSPTITTATPLPSGMVGACYNQFMTATGGVSPYVWTIYSGSLPSGLFLGSNGSITGTPTTATTASFTLKVAGNDGASSNKAFSLTINLSTMSPSITTQPQGATNLPGSNVSFSVVANGTAPLSYQWWHNSTSLSNGGNISGATSNLLVVANIQTSDSGNYKVAITNNFGSITSTVATLIVLIAPTISSQPYSASSHVGSNVTFSVSANGTGPLIYQWKMNNTNLFNGGQFSGVKNNMLTITNIQMSNAGNYNVLVTNLVGSVISSNAVLTVN